MKEWYTAQELTDLQLGSLPKSKSNVISRAKKDSWINRKRTGKGGGLEYAFSGLPKEVQTEIKAKELRALMPKPNSQERTVALMGRDLDELTDKGRQIADMRMLMALLVADYEDDMGRDKEAPSQNNALYTAQECIIPAGITQLSNSGIHEQVSIVMRWADKYNLKLANLGDIWQINDKTADGTDDAWRAIVQSVALDVKVDDGVPVIWQTVGLDRYLDT